MKMEKLIFVQPMERTGRLRSAGTDVSDVRGRLNAKFAYIKDAFEFEMSVNSLLRVMLNASFEYQRKMAMVSFAYFLGNAFLTSFCRKPRKLQFFQNGLIHKPLVGFRENLGIHCNCEFSAEGNGISLSMFRVRVFAHPSCGRP